MRFIIKGPLKENVYNLMRKAGYHFQGKNEEKGELNFVRPPKGYPRFHLFVKIENEGRNLIFNLHLDQKRPIYEGAPAHAGEYDGEVVEREAKRIKQIFRK
ncbi:MAG: hypothetical protein QME57_00755 [Patescibacteria group bacterium]|nr:hypothetical protein [Patescibacteria group bacterium]